MADEWDHVLDDILADNGAASQAVLAAGHPIYYVEGDTPEGLLIKKYPDGHRELVRCNTSIDEVVRRL